MIPIDFVAGTHGNFVEIMLNKFFHKGIVDFDPFTDLGTSHNRTFAYRTTRLFCSAHWSELFPQKLNQFNRIISIKFKHEDLLLISSLSLLRAGDLKIDNDQLEIDTYNKLNNKLYQRGLSDILNAYPFLKVNETNSDIPRYILREFFKFGFANPTANGHWQKQLNMIYPADAKVFDFNFDSLYDITRLTDTLKKLEEFIGEPFDYSNEFYQLHSQFLNKIPYKHCRAECDSIIAAVIQQQEQDIPKLTLFQESYINARLENHYQKEMPFQQDRYFTNTKDVLQYITTQAPNL